MKILFILLPAFLFCKTSDAASPNDSCYDAYVKAWDYVRVGKNADALSFLDSCIKRGCDGTAFYNLSGCTIMTLTVVNDDKHNMQAIGFFNKALAQDSSNARLYNNRGWALQNLSKTKYSDALKDFQKAVALDPADVDYHGNVLRILWMMRRYRDAMDYADKIITLFPGNGYAYYVRGNLKRDYLHKYAEGNIDIRRSGVLKWHEGMNLRY